MDNDELMAQIQQMMPPIKLQIRGELFVQNPLTEEEKKKLEEVNGEVKNRYDEGRE